MALVDLARFDAAVFDLDGTLVDSEPAWEKAKLAVAQQHGRSITRAQLDASVGRSMDELVATVFAPADADAARAIEKQDLRRGREMAGRSAPTDPRRRRFSARPARAGAADCAVLLGAGISDPRCALVQLLVLDLVEVIVSADPLPRRKPDPYPYQLTAEKLALPPDRLIGFEDALPGARSRQGRGPVHRGHRPRSDGRGFRLLRSSGRRLPRSARATGHVKRAAPRRAALSGSRGAVPHMPSMRGNHSEISGI